MPGHVSCEIYDCFTQSPTSAAIQRIEAAHHSATPGVELAINAVSIFICLFVGLSQSVGEFAVLPDLQLNSILHA